MMQKITRLPGFLIFIIFLTVNCGVQAADVPPVNQIKSFPLTLDRSQISTADRFIWRDTKGGEKENSWGYHESYWVCTSRTLALYGACPTALDSGSKANTPIRLTLIEQRTRQQQEITLQGYSRSFASCGWGPVQGINNWNYGLCHKNGVGQPILGKALNLWLPEKELAKLPFGGRWTGNLKLLQKIDGKTFNWEANITVNLQDKNNITVWFPTSPTSTPNVDLNLQTLPGPGTPGGQTSGKALLDMCLYDGFNANSTSYSVTLSDGQTVGGRSEDAFSVFRHGQPTPVREQRIDYHVALNYNGQQLTLKNNRALRLNGIDQAKLQSVTLPNIPQPVMCVPTPLTFTTPSFSPINVQSGNYSGNLRVIFTPSL